MNIVNVARRLLVNTGKSLPFAICAIVLISYTESLYAIITESYVDYGDYVSLRKPISEFIGGIFEYDWMTVVVLSILSISLETCIWNKISVLYLVAHLLFKNYIKNIEIDSVDVYAIAMTNITICWFLVAKGLKKLNLFGRTK